MLIKKECNAKLFADDTSLIFDTNNIHRRCSAKKVFLKISQNSREKPVLKSIF